MNSYKFLSSVPFCGASAHLEPSDLNVESTLFCWELVKEFSLRMYIGYNIKTLKSISQGRREYQFQGTISISIRICCCPFCRKNMQRNKQVAMGRKKFNMDPKKVKK